MKKNILIAAVFVLAVLGAFSGPLGAAPQSANKIKVPDKAPSKAFPFELDDVRLLDSLPVIIRVL